MPVAPSAPPRWCASDSTSPGVTMPLLNRRQEPRKTRRAHAGATRPSMPLPLARSGVPRVRRCAGGGARMRRRLERWPHVLRQSAAVAEEDAQAGRGTRAGAYSPDRAVALSPLPPRALRLWPQHERRRVSRGSGDERFREEPDVRGAARPLPAPPRRSGSRHAPGNTRRLHVVRRVVGTRARPGQRRLCTCAHVERELTCRSPRQGSRGSPAPLGPSTGSKALLLGRAVGALVRPRQERRRAAVALPPSCEDGTSDLHLYVRRVLDTTVVLACRDEDTCSEVSRTINVRSHT